MFNMFAFIALCVGNPGLIVHKYADGQIYLRCGEPYVIASTQKPVYSPDLKRRLGYALQGATCGINTITESGELRKTQYRYVVTQDGTLGVANCAGSAMCIRFDVRNMVKETTPNQWTQSMDLLSGTFTAEKWRLVDDLTCGDVGQAVPTSPGAATDAA